MLAATCNKKEPVPENFEAGIYFGSMCCGTADDEFLKPFYKKYSDRIAAYKIMACGKEGEFRILFSAPKLPQTELDAFVSELTTVVQKQESINRAANATIGGMNVERGINKEDYEYCRDSLKVWK